MVNFSYSKSQNIFNMCNMLWKKHSFIYCGEKTAQKLVWRVSAAIRFSYIFHWNCQIKVLFSRWISFAPFVTNADGKHLFLWTINMDLRLHKAKFIRGVLVAKKIRNLLVLYMNIFKNMRQCCRHSKYWEKQFLVTKWSIFH